MRTSDNTFIIRACSRTNDYVGDGLKKLGYNYYPPYYDINIVLRLLREVWFRLNLPMKKIWYNKDIIQEHHENIIIYDPLITADYLSWLRKQKKNSKIIFQYNNLVLSKAKHIMPDDARPYVDEIVSYDKGDCEKYNLSFFGGKFNPVYRFLDDERLHPEYDIVFLGRDKGRAEELLELKKIFENMGLKTYFHICADRALQMHHESYYKPIMPYSEYIELLKKTKAHLNIMPEGQNGLTQRDLESIFNKVKCITNNKHIKEFEIYDVTRFFVLDDDDINDLVEFINVPFKPLSEELLKKYTYF